MDSKVSDDEKASLAAAILAIPRPKEFPPQNVIVPGPNFTDFPVEYWSRDKAKLPPLKLFVGPSCYLTFQTAAISHEELVDWLIKNPIDWPSHPTFKKFESFVKGITVVNDPAERGVKLCKDYLSRTTDEEFFQKVAVRVTKHREDHPITGGHLEKTF